MCNTNTIGAALLAAEAAVIASLVFLCLAIPPSGSIFAAAASIPLLIGAAVSLAIAVVALGVANNLVDACTGGNCGAAAARLRVPLVALISVLGLQAIAIGVGIAGGAVPFVAAIAASAVVACLVAQGPLFAFLGGANDVLARCQAVTNPSTSTALATIVFVVAVLLLIAAMVIAMFVGSTVPPLPAGPAGPPVPPTGG